MIEVLELQDLTDALVFSLSGEAHKRLTISVELASHPSLLFLDEPTSGLVTSLAMMHAAHRMSTWPGSCLTLSVLG